MVVPERLWHYISKNSACSIVHRSIGFLPRHFWLRATFWWCLTLRWFETGRISCTQWVIVSIGIPVLAVLYGVLAEEASYAAVVVAVSEQLQPAVAVALVLLLADEAERCRIGAGSADSHAEAIVERAVGGIIGRRTCWRS